MQFRPRTLAIAHAVLLSIPFFSCAAQPPGANADQHVYEVKGVVMELKPDGKTVVIQHETVSGYMPAMTMPFEARNPDELQLLKPGDAVTFRMIVSETNGWIDQITKVPATNRTDLPPHLSFHVVRDVDTLAVGDLLPEYHFTNELGRAISTSDFKGQVFAFTFFFTRCPYPLFCPLMSGNFEKTQAKLLALTNAPAQWHLLSISFDTEHDTPAELKDYAARYSPDPAHWSFVTGDLTDITALGDQFGEYFGSDGSGGVQHNLRTVVIGTDGRVRKIFTDNKWTCDDLAAAMLAAAKP